MKVTTAQFTLFGLLIFTGFASLKLPTGDSEGTHTGDVVYSILSPDLFNQFHQGQWVLLDGSPLAEATELFQILETNNIKSVLNEYDGVPNRLPDARGVFIRGMNIGRDAKKGDPDGDRKVGSYQADTLKSHNHIYQIPRRGGDGWETDNDEAFIWENRKTSDYGGNETRPKNIVLYIYIKVGN